MHGLPQNTKRFWILFIREDDYRSLISSLVFSAWVVSFHLSMSSIRAISHLIRPFYEFDRSQQSVVVENQDFTASLFLPICVYIYRSTVRSRVRYARDLWLGLGEAEAEAEAHRRDVGAPAVSGWSPDSPWSCATFVHPRVGRLTKNLQTTVCRSSPPPHGTHDIGKILSCLFLLSYASALNL
jgi:hypothetical protein